MGKAVTAARMEVEAARIGFVKARGFGHDRHKTAWEIKCSKCPTEFRAYWPPQVPTEQMIKNMRVRHWDVGAGLRPLCPDCAHKKDKSPAPKPEHQNFKPWAPPLPKTLIAASLLDAGVTLALKDKPPQPTFDEWKAKQGTSSDVTTLLDRAEARSFKGKLLDRLADVMVEKTKADENLLKAQQARAKAAREARLAKIAERKKRREDKAVQDAIHLREIVEKAKDTPKPVETPMTDITRPDFKITHTVFQLLDSVFDMPKRLYRAGYSDARIAKDAGTTEAVVAMLRKEVYGELAEDPRIQSIKDDVSLLEMQAADFAKNMNKSIGDLHSRIDQLRANMGR